MKSLWIKIRIHLYAALLLTGCTGVDFEDVGSPLHISNLPSGTHHSQVFIQSSVKGKVDLLVIVDNSLSMAEEQQRLGARISNFLSTISDVDWQLGITTTDVSDGTYGMKGRLVPINGHSSRILTPRVSNHENLFLNTVVRQETNSCGSDCPSGDEMPLRAAMMAMDERMDANAGLFRDDADLGVLILSDEDENSDGLPGSTRGQDVVDHFRSIWGDSKEMYGYGIITEPGDTSCLTSQARYGNLIQEFVHQTNGLTGSICDSDYGSTLGSIGQNLSQLLGYFELDAIPDEKTVNIRFIPHFDKEDWYVQGNRLYFNINPPLGTQIFVDYIVK